jgi:hypothetical protein
MENEINFKLKYAAKASSSSAPSNFYCNTYDIKDKRNMCTGTQISFKGKL